MLPYTITNLPLSQHISLTQKNYIDLEHVTTTFLELTYSSLGWSEMYQDYSWHIRLCQQSIGVAGGCGFKSLMSHLWCFGENYAFNYVSLCQSCQLLPRMVISGNDLHYEQWTSVAVVWGVILVRSSVVSLVLNF